jgi:hypothetical protein
LISGVFPAGSQKGVAEEAPLFLFQKEESAIGEASFKGIKE